MLALRAEIDGNARRVADRQIYENAAGLKAYNDAENIFLYASSLQEVSTIELFKASVQNGKRVAYPRVTGDGSMEFYEVTELSQLKEGYRGILEPSVECPLADFFPDVIFVPGVAFDLGFMRMGYGKGFYDRYFERYAKELQNAQLVALAYRVQVLDEIPADEHDKRMDIIITEEGIWTREKDN